jgi:hypothetical protein
LYFFCLVSSSGPSIDILSQVPLLDKVDILSQVPLLDEVDILSQVPLLDEFLLEMNAAICRRLERSSKNLQKFIPYPPQPYLLTCPQVFEIKKIQKLLCTNLSCK